MPEGGCIDVKVKKQGEGKISSQIIVQGIGIPKERLATLGAILYNERKGNRSWTNDLL